ncbi:uncharacterized protein FTOL_11360 [Fusarium torulosum]|uniref:Uncharacterized protein n=1 Tax=Fusarium torulosum TaxID=33205 RepID=A0AAE8MIA9_9HYPO|nr:uncharacterized protein FTOL_11360 [Fusarium torulosum]
MRKKSNESKLILAPRALKNNPQIHDYFLLAYMI